MPASNLDVRGRIPELDGLRGIAIGTVLIYHYFLLTLRITPGTLLAYVLASGRLAWSGVDLFFVLSGFLIGGILLDARDSSNYFRVFYTRRFYRIVPIYAVVLAGSFLLTWRFTGGFAFVYDGLSRGTQVPWLVYPVFLQNIWMAVCSNLGSFNLGATWSLAVEEQFYLTLPLLVRILSPRRLAAVLMIGIVGAPAIRLLLYSLWPAHTLSRAVLMPCRADALLLGVLGAMALRDNRWRERLQRNRRWMWGILGALAVGCGVLTLRAPTYDHFGMISWGYTWLASFYLCLLLCGLLYRESLLSRCLRWRGLAWLGSIAYGVYLLHEPIRYAFFGTLAGGTPVIASLKEFLLTALALLVTLVVCRASWLYFEKPLIQVGHSKLYEARKTAQVATADGKFSGVNVRLGEVSSGAKAQ
jgi:peptidoglycan/LPS O-acetylase OafA/YrhL